MAKRSATNDRFDSDSDSDSDGDENPVLQQIRKKAKKFKSVRNEMDNYEFGFENIAKSSSSKPKSKASNNLKNPKKVDTNQSLSKKRKNDTATAPDVPSKGAKESNTKHQTKSNDNSKSPNENEAVDSYDDEEKTNRCDRSSFWTSRKNSKTRFAAPYFDVISNENQKMVVNCKLCGEQRHCSVGNNSNLLSHLKFVSFICFFQHHFHILIDIYNVYD